MTNGPTLERGMELCSTSGRTARHRPPATSTTLRCWEVVGPGRLGRGMPAAMLLGGNALAGLLLPGRLPEARRGQLEGLRQLPARPKSGEWEPRRCRSQPRSARSEWLGSNGKGQVGPPLARRESRWSAGDGRHQCRDRSGRSGQRRLRCRTGSVARRRVAMLNSNSRSSPAYWGGDQLTVGSVRPRHSRSSPWPQWRTSRGTVGDYEVTIRLDPAM